MMRFTRIRAGFALLVALLLGAPVSAQTTIFNVNAHISTASLTAANAGTCAAIAAGCAFLKVDGYSGVSVQVTGTWNETLQFETSLDNSTWVAISMTPPSSTTSVTSTTGNGVWTTGMVGQYFRVRASIYTSGTAVVTINATVGLSALRGSSGGDLTAKYLIQTADAALVNAQVMGALSTGVVYNTTTTGVQSVVVCTAGALMGGAPPTCTTSPSFAGHITVEGVTATGATGTGKFVFDASPVLTTPTLGVATGTRLGLGVAADATAPLLLPNNTYIAFKTSGGGIEGVIGITSGNDIQISPTTDNPWAVIPGTDGDILGNASKRWGLRATTITSTGKYTTYNGVATAGWGTPAVYGSGRSLAQTGDVTSVTTYTVGASDGSFIVSCNALVTAYTAGTQAIQFTYTDEGNTARTLVMNESAITGTLGATIGATGAYECVPLHLRAKAATAITMKTVGTAWTGTYNVEGTITQIG